MPVSRAQDVPAASESVRIHETVTNGFRHPGIGLTKDMLENARTQVIAGREPWYSAFRKMAAHPNSAEAVSCRNQNIKDPSKPDSDTFDSRGMVQRLGGDSDKAWRQALMYWFTGKEVHRSNAMNIIRVWSKMAPAKYKSFPEDHIHACYGVQNLIRAAELMRYSNSPKRELDWTEHDTRDFTSHFVKPCNETFFNRNGHFMNQAGYPMAPALSGHIFTNDRANYEKRVEWFTVNKDAPNKGWSFSIRDLARLVDTNAVTGEKVSPPNIQLVEMGRDQAHAGGDVEIFMNISRMMNAQGTKVDPVTGTISTQPNAVGPYEFLDDRILAMADHFCRFMLGYDTPWIPTPSDIGPNGEIRQVYTRIADNYRGRLRGLDFWDAHYYYTYRKGIDVAKKAPYYHEAFAKRIVNSDFDWLFIPRDVRGEGVRVPQTEQEPAVVEIEQRSTAFDKNAAVVAEEDAAFLRVIPAADGTRIAILSCDTDSKTLGMRVRTTGPAEIAMSGFVKPWLLPDTQGEWRMVAYTMDALEDLGDIVYFTVKAAPDTLVDLDQLVRKPGGRLAAPEFTTGNGDLRVVAAVGMPLQLDFSTKDTTGVRIESLDKPAGATLDSATGAFQWTPEQAGDLVFLVTTGNGGFLTPKRVRVNVAADRLSAIRAIASAHNPKIDYVEASLKKCMTLYSQTAAAVNQMSDSTFAKKLLELQAAFDELLPLTPLLPDGSMDFPRIVVSTTTKPGEIAFLADGNDDTFAIYTSAKDLGHVFDFGEDFQFSATAFATEGRLNFENRTQDAAFFGSNDGKKWVQLTPEIKTQPTELTRVEVTKGLQDERFRFLKIQKINRNSAPIFEPSEMRIYGQRHELK
ncbi:MAG: putative Ig domain-containing protein [Verrucomicrobiae bacterium]|nr:putative Ig domain-containing protein [Verrucomicrobiae bacterium]MCP5532307.1 putative Ig domain-containing protein [Akkermansiaceae bacterium]